MKTFAELNDQPKFHLTFMASVALIGLVIAAANLLQIFKIDIAGAAYIAKYSGICLGIGILIMTFVADFDDDKKACQKFFGTAGTLIILGAIGVPVLHLISLIVGVVTFGAVIVIGVTEVSQEFWEIRNKETLTNLRSPSLRRW